MFWEGKRATAGVAVALCAALAGCGGGDSGGVAPAAPALSAQAAAGKALFFDKSLSASAEQSCATCHVPSRAFTADPATDRGLPVPLGGRHMDLPGFRNAPSLVYAHLTPAFFLDDDTPTGGFFRDGRASSLEVQAQQPFISEFEMGNRSAAEVITRLQASPAILELFVAAFGAQVLADPDAALADIRRPRSPVATRRPLPPRRSMTWWRSCARSPTVTTRSSLPLTTCRRSARRARTDR